jgi:hypothetical protein
VTNAHSEQWLEQRYRLSATPTDSITRPTLKGLQGKNEMRGTCSTHAGIEECVRHFFGTFQGKIELGTPGCRQENVV